MQKCYWGVFFVLAAALVASLSASAQYEYDESLNLYGPGTGEAEFNRHHLSLLTGWTFAQEGEEDAFTLGIDYEYRVNSFFGVGGVFEHADDPLDATTILLVADFHIWRGLAIQTGPGVLIEDLEHAFSYRIGALYEFELGRNFSFSPQLHYDINRGIENEWITALAFGCSF